jgi:zinc protease
VTAGTSPGLPGVRTAHRLDNGLEVQLLRNADAPVVTTALTYRAGSRLEPAGRSGLAHFLEHMMFKGSARFGPGEIDRRTRRLGGSNNAFTTHDSTTYHFSFAADRWHEALDLEADRMRGLTLAPPEIERERSVILEELAMYEAEPWDALERRVLEALFGDHSYGRPIIGRRADVEAIGAEDLVEFHRRRYLPDNAVLVVAGGLGDDAIERVATAFGDVPAGDPQAAGPLPPGAPAGASRVVIERGGVDRLLLALPTPPLDHPDFPALRLAGALLATGRSGRLNDRLVERDSLCGWVAASLSETDLGGTLTIVAETVPGVDPHRVEEIVLAELERLRRGDLERPALDRARRMLAADWVFAHERIEAQALTLAQASAGPGPDYPDRQLAAIAALDPDPVVEAARRWLDPALGSVLGWSLADRG